jgi:hypothetical protein
MAVGYLRFVIDNGRFLAFGFLFSLCSSFGQTFFIALFGEIRAAFDLSHGGYGTVAGRTTSGPASRRSRWPASATSPSARPCSRSRRGGLR